jgi:cell division protein FtsB
MRRINTEARVVKVNMPALLSKEFFFFVLVLAVVVWVGYAFAQEALLNHRLNAEAAQLRQQNATIAAQNQGYQKDLHASSAGAAADEDARQHGYARSDERVYVVGTPANPASGASMAPKPVNRGSVTKVSGEGRQGAWWQSMGRWIANFWHR